MDIIGVCRQETEDAGKCAVRNLAELAKISKDSAHKGIEYHDIGIIIPSGCKQGHGITGIGCFSGMKIEHHVFIFQVYLNNLSMPNDGYVEELLHHFGVKVSTVTITRWFYTIGAYKGTMRVTPRYPHVRDSWLTYRMVK